MRIRPGTALLLSAGIAVAALAFSEVTMQPTQADRTRLIGIVLGVTAFSAIGGWALSRVVRRVRSLRVSMLLASVGALAAVVATMYASSVSMFTSNDDLRLSLLAVGLGVGLGAVLAAVVAEPLTADIERIGEVANAVASGDRAVRTGIERPDEIGTLARGVDQMISDLAASEDEREKMEAARRRFLADVTHDLRTPLTSMQAAIEAMQDGIASDPERYLSAMAADVTMLSGLVDDVFLLARLESGDLALDRTELDLRELADEALEAVRVVAQGQDVDVLGSFDAAAPVYGSERELRRVLRNLLDNAVRHSPPNSQVRIVISVDQEVTVDVHDEGPGFDPAFIAVAFDRFTRGDAARTRAEGGAGLGLALTRALVLAHGGAVAAFPGPGGRVTVTLPLAVPGSN